jgi:arsenate reductase
VLTIYGIPSCDSCQKAQEFTFHDLRADGLDIDMLQRWTGTIDWDKLLNTRSLTWRKVPEVDRSGMTPNKAMALMLDQPTLVKRPVLESDGVVVVGFSPANYEKIFA